MLDATFRCQRAPQRNESTVGAQHSRLVRAERRHVPSIRLPTPPAPSEVSHAPVAYRPAPEFRPARRRRGEPEDAGRGRRARRRGRCPAAGRPRAVPDRVRHRGRRPRAGRARRRARRAGRRRDRRTPRPRGPLRLPGARRRADLQLLPADRPRRHAPGELPQDPPLRLLRAGVVHPRRGDRGPGGAGRHPDRPADLLRRRVPGERTGARPGRHRPAAGAHRADAPVPVRRRIRRPRTGLREPDVRGVRQPDRPGRRVRVRRAELPGRPRRHRTHPRRARRGAGDR